MKKQALLIGINEYPNLPKLKFARQDAESVAGSLKLNYGFSDNEVMLLTDAKPGLFNPSNREKIQKHLESLADQDLDLFIFGFWGHGLFCNGKRYLCPLNASVDNVEELGFSFSKLQQFLINVRAKNTCMILDCCQKMYGQNSSANQAIEENTIDPLIFEQTNLDDPAVFTAADQLVLENISRDIVFKIQEKEPEFVSNVAILNSCKEGQSAYEWDSRKHGIFTAHLLDAMDQRYDSLLKLVSYVSQNVEKTAEKLGMRQTPFYKLEGDLELPAVQGKPDITGVQIVPSPVIVNSDVFEKTMSQAAKMLVKLFQDSAKLYVNPVTVKWFLEQKEKFLSVCNAFANNSISAQTAYSRLQELANQSGNWISANRNKFDGRKLVFVSYLWYSWAKFAKENNIEDLVKALNP
ncbi:MAG: caspase family protein [Thermoguttaceae bacterium]|nr:caspase family protein [Thermoguttaceae bacterium]